MLSRSGSKAAAAPSTKAYDYESFLVEGSRPNAAAAATAASYRAGVADSAARQAELESAKRRGRRAPAAAPPAGLPAKSVFCSAGRIWMYLICVVQMAVAAVVIAVTAACLSSTAQTTAVVDGVEVPVTTSVCYGTTRSFNTCYWSYIAAACSIAVSGTVLLMNLLCPRRRQACCLSLEALLGLAGAAWWTAAGVAALVFANEADDAGLPKSDCRLAVWALSFGAAGLFALSFLSSFFSCCAACGPRDEDWGGA
jgi:hypothetical protein